MTEDHVHRGASWGNVGPNHTAEIDDAGVCRLGRFRKKTVSRARVNAITANECAASKRCAMSSCWGR